MGHCLMGVSESGFREVGGVLRQSTFLRLHQCTTKLDPHFDSCFLVAAHSGVKNWCRSLDDLDLSVGPCVGLVGLYLMGVFHAQNRRHLLDDALNHHCFLLGAAAVEGIYVIMQSY